jgi:type IV secretion system protein VirB10
MSEAADEPPPVPDLRLRADPPRVMRLSRKALSVVGLLAGAAIGGSLLYALQPAHKTASTELYTTDGRSTADVLNSAPKDYAQVPKLGPALPGDLGRPILSARLRGSEEPAPALGSAASPMAGTGAGANAAQAARQRARQERDSARTSKLFLASASGGGGEGGATGSGLVGAAVGTNAAAATPAIAAATLDGNDDQAHKRAFLGRDAERDTVSVDRLEQVASPYILQAGSIIPAALITGIRSDLPGQITAQVTANVYDSPTGRLLLIPQGSRLIGEYDSSVAFGQNRILLAWNRLILPDGRSIVLARQPGADPAGFAGLQDGVDHHWGGIAKAALLSTILGVGAQVGAGGDSDLIRALRQGASDSVSQSGQQIVRQQLNVQPTLTIRPGYPVRLIVTRDLILTPPMPGDH